MGGAGVPGGMEGMSDPYRCPDCDSDCVEAIEIVNHGTYEHWWLICIDCSYGWDFFD